jgi:beta-mannanase
MLICWEYQSMSGLRVVEMNNPKKIRRLFAAAMLVFTMLNLAVGGFQPSRPAQAAAAQDGILLGSYPEGWLDQTLINNELIPMDNWAGKRASMIGMYSYMEDIGYLAVQLDYLWNSGYIGFINLQSGATSNPPTAAQIATGKLDTALNKWAQTYAAWAKNGKWAFIAPLPEMNMPWTSYGRDPANYKLAFAHIQQIFSQNGVSSSGVRWVFAPNGWDQLPFDSYYPGDSRVDVVGFSVFNDGYCNVSIHKAWRSPAEIMNVPLRNMRNLAPNKPIFITRIGTSAYTAANTQSTAAKNQWLTDAYTYLANSLGVKGVLYYNYAASAYNCDWTVYKSSGSQFTGYKSGIANSRYTYQTPGQFTGYLQTPVLKKVFTAFISNNSLTTGIPIMLGSYSQAWPGAQSVFDNEYHALDAWAGKPLSLAGTFAAVDTDTLVNIEMTLYMMWNNGYIPFVNLNTIGFTTPDIASGKADSYIRAAAHSYIMALDGHNDRMAYIAPLQEMNSNGTIYGTTDTASFKLAYRRFQSIFASEGVPANTVKWVFAPNGNSPSGWPNFSAYYPGDAYVDVVGFTTLNFGYCSWAPVSWRGWHTNQEVFGNYLSQMLAVAPNKPIFITQTATSGYTAHGYDKAAKDAWLRDAYNYLAAYPAVKAVLYYNRWDAECDWSFYEKDGEKYSGYQQGISNPAYGYISQDLIQNLVLFGK